MKTLAFCKILKPAILMSTLIVGFTISNAANAYADWMIRTSFQTYSSVAGTTSLSGQPVVYFKAGGTDGNVWNKKATSSSGNYMSPNISYVQFIDSKETHYNQWPQWGAESGVQISVATPNMKVSGTSLDQKCVVSHSVTMQVAFIDNYPYNGTRHFYIDGNSTKFIKVKMSYYGGNTLYCTSEIVSQF